MFDHGAHVPEAGALSQLYVVVEERLEEEKRRGGKGREERQ